MLTSLKPLYVFVNDAFIEDRNKVKLEKASQKMGLIVHFVTVPVPDLGGKGNKFDFTLT